MMSVKTVAGHKSTMSFTEKVWLGIFVVCSLFWVSLAAAGVYAAIA
ncbi:hypothetical protein [Rouxiella chamberiensis]|uniref:YmiA family membrane protein n=1 Tax=Rouxiella chamberiensis TaxID=1513468 RepID=A0ABY7HTH3_9GAMM|nr:hypothetical protein [Rouxiella chamberiensis]WAT02126.1 hypothetical protein O1V66_05525 [Rouxiella chamberiensis]